MNAGRGSAWDVLERQQQQSPVLEWDPGQPIVLAIDSEKGGVGKSALTAGLTAVMAAAGHAVLAIDLDPRATLTAELGAELAEGEEGLGINDLLAEDSKTDPDELPELRGLAEQALRPAGPGWGDRVQVLASERALANRETDNTTPNMEHRLAVALDGVAARFSLVVIDLPPRAGGKLVSAGLLAATHVLFPGTLNEDGLVGIRDARRTVKLVARSHPGKLRSVGVVRNIVERRTKVAELIDTKFATEFDDVLDVVIPKRIVREEARTACVPITAATGRDAAEVIGALTLILNRISEAT